MKKITTSLAVTAALMSGVVCAETNPFGATELPASGYLQLAEAEMKCGANMKMDTPQSVAEKAVEDKKNEATKAVETKASDAVKSATPAIPAVPTLKH